jgi:hypothetical protein
MRWKSFLRLLLGVISLAGAIAYCMAIAGMYDSGLFEVPQFKAAFIGFVVGALLWLVLSRWLAFFATFEHELTHLIFSILMFQRPRSFYASERKGHVASDSGNFIDGLAPYYFPTFSYVLLGIYPLLRSSAQMLFYPVLGFFTGFHLVSNVMEFELGQSDIRKAGVVFSFLFCTFAGAVTFGFIAAFVIGGFRGGLDFLAIGAQNIAGVVTDGAELAWRGITGFAPPAK